MACGERRATSDERFAASGLLAISSAGVSGYGQRGGEARQGPRAVERAVQWVQAAEMGRDGRR
jgi:hypothetical protein